MEEISDEDINWLYYGDLTNQIIARLENNISPFEKFINDMYKYNVSTFQILQQILIQHKGNFSIEFTNINNQQLQRLYILDKKYKMVR
jgi:hypothetical protein